MAVGDAHVLPGFLTPVLKHFFFQSHRLLFSHASAEVRGEKTPERKFASTVYRTHNHQVMLRGFFIRVLTQLSFQSHRLLFSHASAEVGGELTPERKFASTGYRTYNHQVMLPSFLIRVLTQLSFQSHRLLFSHASAKVREE